MALDCITSLIIWVHDNPTAQTPVIPQKLRAIESREQLGGSLIYPAHCIWKGEGFGSEVPIELVSVTMKPENVSPSCKDIIVSMLWEMNCYFQLYACMFCLFRKKLAGTVPPPPPGPSPCYSPDTVFLPNKVSCVKILVNPARVKTLCISRVQSNPGSQECPARHYFRLSIWFTQPLPTFI